MGVQDPAPILVRPHYLMVGLGRWLCLRHQASGSGAGAPELRVVLGDRRIGFEQVAGVGSHCLKNDQFCDEFGGLVIRQCSGGVIRGCHDERTEPLFKRGCDRHSPSIEHTFERVNLGGVPWWTPRHYDRRAMDGQSAGLRASTIYVGLALTVALIVGGCGGSGDPTAGSEQVVSTEQSASGTEAGDGEASGETVVLEGSGADDEPEPEPGGADANPDDDGSVERLLASVEGAAQPLGDVIGVTHPSGLEPVTRRVDSYPRLCPAEDLAIEAVLQEDPLVENLPVQRYVIAFPGVDEATEFFDDLASTEVGCVGERTGEVAIATATINEVAPLAVIDDLEAVEISASIAVDMVNLDRDPPGSDVVRSAVVEGSTVIIVVSIAGYGSVIGVEDVHGPLLTDGAELVRAAG